MSLSVMWQVLSSVKHDSGQRSCVLINTLEVDVIKNKYQLGPRDKWFQLSSMFLFCVRESSSFFLPLWDFRVLFCFCIGHWTKGLTDVSAYTQVSDLHFQPRVHIFIWHDWLCQSENSVCCQLTWTLGALRVRTTNQRACTVGLRPPRT